MKEYVIHFHANFREEAEDEDTAIEMAQEELREDPTDGVWEVEPDEEFVPNPEALTDLWQRKWWF